MPTLERDKSLTEGCVRCSKDEKGHRERDEEVQIPNWIPRKSLSRRSLMGQHVSSSKKGKSEYER